MGIEQARSVVSAALRSRQGEIEQAARARVRSVSDPAEVANPEYVEGLGAAVTAALDYGIEALARGGERALPMPTALLSQARLAARNKVSLDTVLRRYFAGYTLLSDYVIEEAGQAGASDGTALKQLMRAHAGAFDRLLAAVTEEYNREAKRPVSDGERRAERIERLLAGEPLDAIEPAYDFEGWHLGMVACGDGVSCALQALAKGWDRNLLMVDRQDLGGSAIWAWLGGRQEFEPRQLEGLPSRAWPDLMQVAIGEPGEGLAGWRFTYRQAAAAFPVVQRSAQTAVRYGEAALLSAALQDEVLKASLDSLYLAPLAVARDGGATHRETLRAYFAAECNVSSTAADLRINRKTVTARLHAVEHRLGLPIARCAAELETALRLQAIDGGAASGDSTPPTLPRKTLAPAQH